MRILIIENDSILVAAMTRILGRQHEVSSAIRLEAALELVESTKFDLITIDLRMNGKNRCGLEAYYLARKKWGLDLPIAVVTGCDDDMLDDAKNILALDPNYRVYKKPINVNTLDDIIAFSIKNSVDSDT